MEGLVVVDMQPNFTGMNDVLDQVKELVKTFRDRNKPVFIVEYASWEGKHTHRKIWWQIQDYKNVFFLRKNTDDGSEQVDSMIKLANLDVEELVVCGVNASFCVSSTIHGLVHKGYKVMLPEEATCNAPDQRGPEYRERYGANGLASLERLAQHDNRFMLISLSQALGLEPFDYINV